MGLEPEFVVSGADVDVSDGEAGVGAEDGVVLEWSFVSIIHQLNVISSAAFSLTETSNCPSSCEET